MLYKQIELQRGNSHQVVWTDLEKKFQEGSRIRLKDTTEWWTVVKIYSQSMEKKEINTNRFWDSGGLKTF